VSTTEEGTALPVVIDFGIAKARDEPAVDRQNALHCIRDAHWNAGLYGPEQAALTGVDVDTRTDIYSLGVLLYELLTGATPFDNKELLQAGLDETRRVIREQEPAPPSTRLSHMSEADLTTLARARHSEPPTLIRSVRGDLDWIVMKALEKDRTRRYATANGLVLDIQRLLGHETVSARPPSKALQTSKGSPAK
jgi:serine/threonine protein kinase